MIKLFTKKSLVFSFVILFLASCTYHIAPPYTSVSELIKVRKGMTLNKVNEVLGIQPYDIYTIQDDGSTVLVYNYRIKDRKMSISGDPAKATKTERGQKEGIDWYGEASRVYILFEDDKVASLISDHGREDAELLMLVNNNLQLISKEDLVSLSYNQNYNDLLIMKNDGTVSGLEIPKNDNEGGSKSVFIPVKKQNEKGVTATKAEPNKKAGAVIGIVTALGAIILIALLLGNSSE